VAGLRVARPRMGRVLRWLLPVWVLLFLVAAGVYVDLFNPTDDVADPGGPCLWHLLTGINGPACGGTRMFYYLIHGNLVQAARHHLPALLVVPVLAYWWLAWMLGRFGVRLPALRLSGWVWLGYGVFFLVFSVVLRNIDWGPLAWFDIPAVGTQFG
jgi:hypothetical protein